MEQRATVPGYLGTVVGEPEGWYSRDSLCCGVGARMMYINAKMQEIPPRRSADENPKNTQKREMQVKNPAPCSSLLATSISSRRAPVSWTWSIQKRQKAPKTQRFCWRGPRLIKFLDKRVSDYSATTPPQKLIIFLCARSFVQSSNGPG